MKHHNPGCFFEVLINVVQRIGYPLSFRLNTRQIEGTFISSLISDKRGDLFYLFGGDKSVLDPDHPRPTRKEHILASHKLIRTSYVQNGARVDTGGYLVGHPRREVRL